MIQIRPGNLLNVRFGGRDVVFAVLTKRALFGGNWSFVFHDPPGGQLGSGQGFNAFVDFVSPKRDGRVSRLSAGNDFSDLGGSSLLKQQPTRGESAYAIYRWSNLEVDSVVHIRTTRSPTAEELSAPEYSCIPADFACELALRRWRPQDRMWSA